MDTAIGAPTLSMSCFRLANEVFYSVEGGLGEFRGPLLFKDVPYLAKSRIILASEEVASVYILLKKTISFNCNIEYQCPKDFIK